MTRAMRAAFILCLVAALLSACMPRREGAEAATAQPADVHTSRDSLDWAGVYEGVLPCADCPGIETRLTLERDGSYVISTRYLDRQHSPLIARGQFTWHAGGNAISLDAKGGGQQYAVGEGRLVLLNRDGTQQVPPSPNRVLTLMPSGVASTPAGPGLVRTLEAHRWSLDFATDGQGRRIEAVSPGPGRQFVFGFYGARLHVQGGCNQLGGSYLIDAEGRMTVSRMAATMMACEPAKMQADAALSDLLARPLKVEILEGAQPRLRLTSAVNDTLVLSGQLTPEARFGAPTIVFLEVAAERVDCRNPLTGATACLQVRERRYDKQGLVVGQPGAWRPLYEDIEGFTHRAGERTVLRVKQFQRGPATPGASSAVYVLDLKIESATVPR